jgi:hypothetical protein
MRELKPDWYAAARKRSPLAVSDLPERQCWIILQSETVHVPGDERSRTHPGHGYPEHTERHWSIQVFDDAESWTKEIELLAKNNREFQAGVYCPAAVETSVTVRVKIATKN